MDNTSLFLLKIIALLFAIGFGSVSLLTYRRISELIKLMSQREGIARIIIGLEAGMLVFILIPFLTLTVLFISFILESRIILDLLSEVTVETFQSVPINPVIFYIGYGLISAFVNIALRNHMAETMLGLGFSLLIAIVLHKPIFNYVDANLKVFIPLFIMSLWMLQIRLFRGCLNNEGEEPQKGTSY